MEPRVGPGGSRVGLPAVSIVNNGPGRNLNEPDRFMISLAINVGIIYFMDAMPLRQTFLVRYA